MIKGKSGSPGIVIGKALILKNEDYTIEKNTLPSLAASEAEVGRFQKSIQTAKAELTKVRERALSELGKEHAAIFDAHLLVLEDPEMVSGTIDIIKAEKVNAEFAFQKVVNQFVSVFEAMKNEYMKERVADLKDVAGRVIRILLGKTSIDLAHLKESVVLVAHDLTPSDTATMDKSKVLGFLTNIGGKTSHTAIMARTLEIPAVLGLKNITELLKDGDTVIFNGETGEVTVRPDDQALSQYKKLQEDFLRIKNELNTYIGLPTVTTDGRKVKLFGNIGTPDDLGVLQKHDAEGVGLFRTEFLFMNRTTMPTEDEQYKAYTAVLKAMNQKETIIRTSDIGGDKEVPYIKIGKELNPFLGLRAIRYCLQDKVFFKIQLRALLRASVHGRLGIMFPMISGLEELLTAKEVLEDVKRDLRLAGIPYSPEIEVGTMIEIPSAAVISDVIAKHVDFLSIGTNDLIQYTCAVDRMNERVMDLYDPYHPAVLRLINTVIQNGHKEGIAVGMCGEMAGSQEMIPILLGMGLHEFSMAPTSILRTRKIIRSLQYEDAKKLAQEVLALESGAQVVEHLKKRLPPPPVPLNIS